MSHEEHRRQPTGEEEDGEDEERDIEARTAVEALLALTSPTDYTHHTGLHPYNLMLPTPPTCITSTCYTHYIPALTSPTNCTYHTGLHPQTPLLHTFPYLHTCSPHFCICFPTCWPSPHLLTIPTSHHTGLGTQTHTRFSLLLKYTCLIYPLHRLNSLPSPS